MTTGYGCKGYNEKSTALTIQADLTVFQHTQRYDFTAPAPPRRLKKTKRGRQIYCFLRPEIFNRVKFGDESQVGLPCFALVILEEPERPSVRVKSRKKEEFA